MGGCLQHYRKPQDESRFFPPQDIEVATKRSNFIYQVKFNSRPLDITVTSSYNGVGGYITQVSPSTSADADIKLNSKLMSVGGIDVENLDIDIIIGRLAAAKVPLVLKLISPEGLMDEEYPDSGPDEVVELYRCNSSTVDLGSSPKYKNYYTPY